MLSIEMRIEMAVSQLEKNWHRTTPTPSLQWLRAEVHTFCAQLDLDKEFEEIVLTRLRNLISTTIGEAAVLVDDKPREEWFTEIRKNKIDWYYWNRFQKHFSTKDIPKAVLKRTDKDTNKILSLLGDPKLSAGAGFRCRGMVIGDVQAGKTNNYSALINKAADAGYKLIIILTGIVEDLRQQTQERLDIDFVGSVSIAGQSTIGRETKTIGVGKADDSRLPFCLTDRESDVKKNPSYSISTIREPILVVTKKNMHSLQRLITWLSSEINSKTGSVKQPVLIIDDEADNASVNTGAENETPKTINRMIREIISCCSRVSYVAYTATPFANIFIHPDSEGDKSTTDDLFPKDFIVALEPPNNYCGSEFFFRNEGVSDDMCIVIDDADEHLPIQHKPGTPIESIPESLKDALGVFLLASAIKDIRRHQNIIRHQHDSMLINMSRLTSVQSDIAPHVDLCIDSYWNAITVNANKNLPETKSGVMHKLFQLWRIHFEKPGKESWIEVCRSLSIMEKPKTVTVHSKSADSLIYDNNGPKKQIAIGGLKLSRGLTLEGLVTSYFYRRSVMYDTLMQMGRWYGYRDNYQDLLRIWITSESLDWYAHISEASDDLREQVADMQRRKMTPSQFGLRVRASPDALMVTAANKMRTAKTIQTRMRFDDRCLETDCVDSRPEIIAANFNEFSRFITNIDGNRYYGQDIPKDHRQHMHYRDVHVEKIVHCLKNLHNHPSCGLWASNDLFLKYIEARSGDELSTWDVFVYQRHSSKKEGTWQDNAGRIYSRLRRGVVTGKPRNGNNPHEMRLNQKQRVSDRGVEALGLSQTEKDFVEDGTGKALDKKYRAQRKKPSLIFHIIRACVYENGDKNQIASEQDVLAWAISIPSSQIYQPDILWSVTKDWFEKYGTTITDETES